MPNENYDLGSARASIAGTTLDRHPRIRNTSSPASRSTSAASEIAPGRTATLEFSIMVSRMVYPDSEDDRYASLQFKTTWYDGKYVSGNAERIEIQFNLPPGTKPDEVQVPRLRPQRLPAERNAPRERPRGLPLALARTSRRPSPTPPAPPFPGTWWPASFAPPKRSILKTLFTAILRLHRLRLLPVARSGSSS